MASIEKRERAGKPVWRAHYRTPAGRQCNKSFARKVDAERFLGHRVREERRLFRRPRRSRRSPWESGPRSGWRAKLT